MIGKWKNEEFRLKESKTKYIKWVEWIANIPPKTPNIDGNCVTANFKVDTAKSKIRSGRVTETDRSIVAQHHRTMTYILICRNRSGRWTKFSLVQNRIHNQQRRQSLIRQSTINNNNNFSWRTKINQGGKPNSPLELPKAWSCGIIHQNYCSKPTLRHMLHHIWLVFQHKCREKQSTGRHMSHAWLLDLAIVAKCKRMNCCE